jgi:hypothetical protein
LFFIKLLLFFVEKRIEEIHLKKCIMLYSFLLIKFEISLLWVSQLSAMMKICSVRQSTTKAGISF